MLHVFLDSNIIFTDPFMEKNIHNRLLIELAENQLIQIYVSDVVKQEVVNNFERKLLEHYDEIKKSEAKITKLLRPIDNSPIEWKETVQNYVTKLEGHLVDLKNYGFIEFIPFTNDILPELVNRSIKRIKPFSERKMEFRDAIIWFSYVDFVKNYQSIDKAYFITKNIKDFTQNGEIHPDLQQDSTDFIFYETTQDFIQNCSEVKELQKALEIMNWVEQENFPNYPNEILSMFTGRWEDRVIDECIQYLYDHVNSISIKFNEYDVDTLEVIEIEFGSVNDVGVEDVLNTVVITGTLDVFTTFEAYQDNPLFELDKEGVEYFHLGTDEASLSLEFSMIINQNKEIVDLNITYITNF